MIWLLDIRVGGCGLSDVICGTTHPHLFYGGGCDDEGVDVDDGGGE